MAVTTRKGSATRHEALGLSLDDVKGMYRFVLMTRLVSERILQLNRMGRTPFGAGTDGHEGAQIGAAWCIQRGKDWTVPYYRDMGVAFVLGFSALDEFRGVLAKATDPNSAGRAFLNMFSSPKDRIVSGSVCVGTEFPHAVGLALALKLRKEPYIVFAFGGDASTSTGDFHEAMNFAAVHKLPVVFVIENNLIAISTRIERQTAVKDIADKAAAYAMPGHVADGMDVLDSYEKTRIAAEHARAGGGPSLVELKCYRYQPHTSDDDDSRYRTKQEVEEWRAKDPLKRWADQHSAAVPRVKLKVVDVAGSPSKTALELRRAAVEDRADAIVVGVAVDYDDAFDNIVQLAHVPVLFTLPIREPATRDGGWAFALAPTPAQLSRVVLDDAARRSGLSSSLIVSDESTTAIIDRIAITTELGRRQVNPIVITVTAADATGKLRPLLASTSTVILAGTPRSYVDAARNVKPGTTLYLSYVSELAEIGDLRDAAALAVWPGSRWITASAAAAGGSTVARSSFVQAYSDRAGPPSTVAASAYDALALLASVAEKGTASEQMRERLESSSL